ncbi:MAG: glycosyltransferase family 2 protein [Prevotella sp.]|nr:glycosyltransferase family 2 protein [Prevotella sp.]
MKYEVTIGIPVYNAERFIGRSLGSALMQSFGSIEFLVIDDCSTDGTLDVVRRLQEEHPRGGDIRIVTQPVNKGVGAARNRIIGEMRGRYLFFLDADDTMTPDAVACLHENAARCSAELVFGSYEVVSESNPDAMPERHVYPDADLLGADRLACYAFRKYGGIQVQIWNCLISRELLGRTGLRFLDITMGEDAIFIKQLVTMAERAVLRPEVTYRYIHRDNSLTNLQRRDHIDKSEIILNMETGDILKRYAASLSGKPYLGNWCFNVVMDGFYMICSVLKKEDIIRPGLTYAELNHFLAHPLRLTEIMRLKSLRAKNLLLYALWKLPPVLSVSAVKALGRAKGLI